MKALIKIESIGRIFIILGVALFLILLNFWFENKEQPTNDGIEYCMMWEGEVNGFNKTISRFDLFDCDYLLDEEVRCRYFVRSDNVLHLMVFKRDNRLEQDFEPKKGIILGWNTTETVLDCTHYIELKKSD